MPAKPKIDSELKRRFVAAVRRGLTFTEACDRLGVTRWAVHLQRSKDKAFDTAIRDAIRVALVAVEDALFRQAVNGNTTAAIFFLVNRSKHLPLDERWQNTNTVSITAQVAQRKREKCTTGGRRKGRRRTVEPRPEGEEHFRQICLK